MRQPSVFLSHSSKDKPLARRIAKDLVRNDIDVWLDEWELLVGDSITQKIQHGLESTDFVAVLITANGLASGWVEKEWMSKVSEEASTRDIVILPLKADSEPLPHLLRDKKYADFSASYKTGVNDLVSAVKGHVHRKMSAGTELHNSGLNQVPGSWIVKVIGFAKTLIGASKDAAALATVIVISAIGYFAYWGLTSSSHVSRCEQPMNEVNLIGHDEDVIQRIVLESPDRNVRQEQCRNQCVKNSECSSWSFHLTRMENNNCWLYKSLPASHGDSSYNSGYVLPRNRDGSC